MNKCDKCKILLFINCRSDDPLTQPMLRLLENDDFFSLNIQTLYSGNFHKNYNMCNQIMNDLDCVLIMGDRIELTAAACAAFHNNVPIIHYGSGITNTISTFDDINRHCISLWADVCLCEDQESKRNVFSLRQSIGKIRKNTPTGKKNFDRNNIYVVGNLYLETLSDVDESLVPNEIYDLQLINPETLKTRDIYSPHSQNKKIIIGPNPDNQTLQEIRGKNILKFYKNLPRPQFLGLLKNCQRFITNSSSAYYEAPHFLKSEQIIQVGERNKNRSTPREWNQDFKSSDKIIEIIKEWWRK
ncbi:MAG: UDP-N-acetyl glucosamine 2-epimerase [Candidatus Peregrinibacteria bacterium]|nr:UDP-N-acetyl glucosamine 2-epimerase [Candidatus Peregrinibacteria bacterium]